MLANELYYKVEKILDDKIDINGYQFTKTLISVPGNIKLPCYINEKAMEDLVEGNYYYSKKAYLTGMGNTKPKEREISFRVDFKFDSSEEEFLKQKETVVKFNGLIRNGSNNILKKLGPMLVPTFVTTCILKNELRETFYLMVVGFHNRAKSLSEIGVACYVDITGVLSIGKPNKPCSVIVRDIILRKEVA